MAYAGNLRDYTWSFANFFQREFESARTARYVSWALSPALYYLSPRGFGVIPRRPSCPLCCWGWWSCAGTRRVRHARCSSAGRLRFHVFFAGNMQNPRFPLSTSRRSLWRRGWVCKLLARIPRGANARLAARLVLGAIFVACLVPGTRQSIRDHHDTQTKVIPTEIAFAKWAAARTPPQYVLLAQGNSMILSHNAPHRAIDLFNLTDDERTAILAQDGELYLMMDPAAVAKQWTGRRPMAHVEWLQTHTEFTEIGVNGKYHLYRALVYEMP